MDKTDTAMFLGATLAVVACGYTAWSVLAIQATWLTLHWFGRAMIDRWIERKYANQ